jgi:hypothetical protein
MTFDVVDSLISSPNVLAAERISYSYPEGWTDNTELAKRATENTGRGIELMAAYGEESTRSYFVISRLDSSSRGLLDEVLAGYKSEWEQREDKPRVLSGVFRKGEFDVRQVLATSHGVVLMKLVFSSDEVLWPIQLDFVVPASEYPTKLKQIESVIGSITIHLTHH